MPLVIGDHLKIDEDNSSPTTKNIESFSLTDPTKEEITVTLKVDKFRMDNGTVESVIMTIEEVDFISAHVTTDDGKQESLSVRRQ